MAARVPVLLVADAPVGEHCLPLLAPILDGARREALQKLLIRRALAWAGMFAAERVVLALRGSGGQPAAADRDAGEEFGGTGEMLEVRNVEPGIPATVALARELMTPRGLVISGTAVPAISAGVGHAALADLDAGCDASFGVAIGGGFHLLALRDHTMAMIELGMRRRDRDGERTLHDARELAREDGLFIGMLRYERELHDVGDARAWLSDPSCPADVRRLLAAP